MGLGEAVGTCLRKYADFDGRARRSEYWYFRLFIWMVYLSLWLAIFLTSIGMPPDAPNEPGGILLLIGIVFMLAVWLPDMAVTVRRLHDAGYSGWMYLIALVPFGGFVLLALTCMRGTYGDNQYGPDPLGPSARVFE